MFKVNLPTSKNRTNASLTPLFCDLFTLKPQSQENRRIAYFIPKGLALVFLLGLILNATAFGQTDDFFDLVLGSDGGKSEYLIPITVKSGAYSGKVVVTSRDLFDLLNTTKGFDASRYQEFVMTLLKNKEALLIDDVIVDDRGFFLSGGKVKNRSFRIVNASADFELAAANSCEQLIRHYFSPTLPKSKESDGAHCKTTVLKNAQDLLMRPKFDFYQQNNVVARLFEYGIPVFRDDISGSFAIGYLTLK